MNIRKGYTLLELIVVIAILVTLAAVINPILARGVQASKEARSKSNLRQHFLALEIYRADHERASYGTASDMGFPPPIQVLTTRLDLPVEIWESPCDPDAKDKTSPPGELAFSYMYLPNDSNEFLANTLLKESRTFLIADLTCNPYPPTFGAFLKRKVLAVRMSGEIISMSRFGDPTTSSWWGDQE